MKKFYTIIIILIFNTLINTNPLHSKNSNELYEKIDLFSEVLETIKNEYVDEIDQAEIMDSAAQIYYDDYQEELLILSRELTVPKEGVFLFSDLKISKLAIDNVESLNFVLTLNIWIGRKSSELNIFTEDKFIYGNIYTIRGKTFSSFVEML